MAMDLDGKSRRNAGHSAGHCDGGTLTSQYGNFSVKFLFRVRCAVEALMVCDSRFSLTAVSVAAGVERLVFVGIASLVCVSEPPSVVVVYFGEDRSERNEICA
jgi:hypothetical protein